MKVRLGDLTQIKTGKLDANASSSDGEYPFFTCSKEPLKIATYSYDCECVLVAGNGDLNVKYYNGKFDAYQRTYIIEGNGDGRLFIPYLYLFNMNTTHYNSLPFRMFVNISGYKRAKRYQA